MSWQCLKCKVLVDTSDHKQYVKGCTCLYCHRKKCDGVLKGDLI